MTGNRGKKEDSGLPGSANHRLPAIINSIPVKQVMAYLVLAILFAIVFGLRPLYSSDQNNYFPRGFAQAGHGFLGDDWYSRTADPVPVFTVLVRITYEFLHPNMFLVYQILLMATYLYCLASIAAHIYPSMKKKSLSLVFLTIILLLHSRKINTFISEFTLDFLDSGFTRLLFSGVVQSILSPELDPSQLTILLMPSILFFLREKYFTAIFFSSLAGLFHPPALITAGILTIVYMGSLFKESGSLRKALELGIFALIIVLPAMAYNYVSFAPTSDESWSESVNIIGNFRNAYLKFGNWFDNSTIFKLLLVVAVIYLARDTRLFNVVLVLVSATVTLTAVQVFTNSNSLQILQPWRIFTLLVPVSSAILIAHLINAVHKRIGKTSPRFDTALGYACIIIILLLVLAHPVGFLRTKNKPMMDYVKETNEHDNIYLLPVSREKRVRTLKDLEDFRLYTGAPILVDYKAHPYRDVDVIEWFRRLNDAYAFFHEKTDNNCTILERLQSDYQVTHVVSYRDGLRAECLPHLRQEYSDDKYVVYEVANVNPGRT